MEIHSKLLALNSYTRYYDGDGNPSGLIIFVFGMHLMISLTAYLYPPSWWALQLQHRKSRSRERYWENRLYIHGGQVRPLAALFILSQLSRKEPIWGDLEWSPRQGGAIWVSGEWCILFSRGVKASPAVAHLRGSRKSPLVSELMTGIVVDLCQWGLP